MDIPVSSPLGFIGIVLLGFGLFLILAGLEIFSIQQITVKKGPKTWGLGIGLLLLGVILIFPEIRGQTQPELDLSPDGLNEQPTQTSSNQEPTDDLTTDQQNTEIQGSEASEPDWRPISFTIPNDGSWTQPTETSYFANGDLTDSFAWSDEIIEGDFSLRLEIESDFDNYGEGMVIVYGEGQSWSLGCLIFNITGYWQAIRIDTIYGDDHWLVYNEQRLENKSYTMIIEIKGNTAKLFADEQLVASIMLPGNVNRRGRIGLVKYWESADVSFSNIQILTP